MQEIVQQLQQLQTHFKYLVQQMQDVHYRMQEVVQQVERNHTEMQRVQCSPPVDAARSDGRMHGYERGYGSDMRRSDQTGVYGPSPKVGPYRQLSTSQLLGASSEVQNASFATVDFASSIIARDGTARQSEFSLYSRPQ